MVPLLNGNYIDPNTENYDFKAEFREWINWIPFTSAATFS